LVKEDVRLRLQVVRQHLERGTRTAEVCRIFGISEATLRRWCRNYREEGVEGLRTARTGSTGTSLIASFS
jgi:transposase-like protein